MGKEQQSSGGGDDTEKLLIGSSGDGRLPTSSSPDPRGVGEHWPVQTKHLVKGRLQDQQLHGWQVCSVFGVGFNQSDPST